MSKLFFRDCPDTINGAIQSYLQASPGDHSAAAIVENFRLDHRVSEARAAEWLSLHPVSQAIDFPDAVKKYSDRVRDGRAFLDDTNESNAVFGWNSSNLLAAKEELVTCLDLTGLHEVLRQPMGELTGDYFDHYPRTVVDESEDAVWDWHNQATSADAQLHAEQILKRLRAHVASGYPRHPVWVSRWERVRGALSQDRPDQWLALLGMSRYFRPRRWLMLLKYQVQQTGTLVRPTVLDSGWYDYHYPSPPQAALQAGGHPMNLCDRITSPIPEFIHEQSAHLLDVSYWMPGWLGSTPPTVVVNDLKQLRERHRRVLSGHYHGSLNWHVDALG